jgi:SAM-dependent methyltransferase
VRQEAGTREGPQGGWPGFCCPYCAAPLLARGRGLYCAAEGRWFGGSDGVHRLLSEERRRELLPFLELYRRVRRDEGWRAEPGLPDVARGHRHEAIWRRRARHFRTALGLVEERLGPGPWRVLEAGAGAAWVSLRLLGSGHRVAATDVNLDPDDGLLAADSFLASPGLLPRAEAEMEALPFEPGLFDLVFVSGALHYAPNLGRALVEMRRVTRRGGLLVVTDSPVYARRADGEAMVARRMAELGRRYRVSIPRESQAGYLVAGEIAGAFRAAGWTHEMHGWPGAIEEWARDVVEIFKHGRRTARFPVVLGRRDV